MAKQPSVRKAEYDIIEPIGKRVVIRKDDNKRQTRGGIVLPDTHEIPVITGRVIAVSKAIENGGQRFKTRRRYRTRRRITAVEAADVITRKTQCRSA